MKIHTLFLIKPELQKTVLMAFRRIQSDASLEPTIRTILTDSLMNFAHAQLMPCERRAAARQITA